MANPDRPNGLEPWGSTKVNSRSPEGYKATTTAQAGGARAVLCAGDLVRGTNAGYVEQAAASSTDIVGVFKGCWFTDANGQLVYATRLPASTASDYIELYDDPMQLFVIQGATGVAFAQTHVGNNCDTGTAANGTAIGTGGFAVTEADLSTVAATSAQLKIHGLAPQPGNALGEHAKIIVSILEHLWSQGGGSAAAGV